MSVAGEAGGGETDRSRDLRGRLALTDYANALLLQDWHEEQRAARRAGLVLDG